MNAQRRLPVASPIATPDDILRAALRKWPVFLQHWAAGNECELFPLRLRVRLKLGSTEDVSLPQMATAVQALRKQSKEMVGSGYTVHYSRRRSRNWGEQDFPDRVTIDTRDDLLALVGKRESLKRAEQVRDQVRSAFPELAAWLVENVRRLDSLADVVDSLIAVCRSIRSRPLPDCYVRELQVPVDTKFIEKHETTLRHWLDRLLPPEAIQVEELSFARRYGLRDGLPHHLLRVLDPALLSELSLPMDELSLPMRHLTNLPVTECTVIIVENRTNLLTLPERPRGLALGGVGDAVTRLRDLAWLNTCRVFYWGDIDVDGFRILRNLRKLLPETRSLMMDIETLSGHRNLIGQGNGKTDTSSMLLSTSESDALSMCSSQNVRLEQEKLPQQFVLDSLSRI